MKALWKLATLAAVATALAVPASAQIISTSLPSAKAGAARDKFSMHIMATPFAWWDYKEVYFNVVPFPLSDDYDVGLIKGNPDSDFMAAADMAFALGDGDWSVSVGGWYNKIGNKHYEFDGVFASIFVNGFVDVFEQKASIPVDLTMYEGHVGLFYKAFGIQAGIVHTDQESSGDFLDVTLDGQPAGDFPGYAPFTEKTNDWTAFGVFRTSSDRWGLSWGAGVYIKQGITDSPLRFDEEKVVFSGFVTASVNVFKGLGVDVSYWYIGETNEVDEFASDFVTSGVGSDAQSRFTVGIGYTF